MKWRLLICLSTILNVSAFDVPKLTFYVGTVEGTGQAVPVRLIPDVTSSYTLINIRDFVCSQANGCKITSGYNNLAFRGTAFKARYAQTSINIFPTPFDQPMTFLYVDDQNSALQSIVGMAARANFLKYLSQRNQTAAAYTIDSKAQLSILSSTEPQNSFLYFDLSNFVELEFPVANKIQKSYQKFCLTNALEVNLDNEVYFSVESKALPDWKEYLKSRATKEQEKQPVIAQNALTSVLHARIDAVYKVGHFQRLKSLQSNTVKDNMADVNFELQDEHEHELADLKYDAKQLYDQQKGEFAISGFTVDYDDFQKCNFYTGQLFLRENDVKFHFLKQQGGEFKSFWTFNKFDGSHPILELDKSHPFFEWDLLLYTTLYIIGAVFIWQYVLKDRRSVNEEVYQAASAQEMH